MATDLVAPYVPHLSRLARALTGSQERGDHLVATLLSSIVSGRVRLRSDLPSKIALYHAFMQDRAARQCAPMTNGDAGHGPPRAIDRSTPRDRMAYLLSALDDLTAAEIGAVLGIEAGEAERLVRSVESELSLTLGTRVMIMEDEPLIALDLADLVIEAGHEVIGIARTKPDAIALARAMPPGLVIADVKLAEGSSGLDAVGDLLEEMMVPVIFITAYPQRLLGEHRVAPAFLITKPFRPHMVRAMISQALYLGVSPLQPLPGAA